MHAYLMDKFCTLLSGIARSGAADSVIPKVPWDDRRREDASPKAIIFLRNSERIIPTAKTAIPAPGTSDQGDLVVVSGPQFKTHLQPLDIICQGQKAISIVEITH
mgnify:CR=1 FL=1